MPLSKLLIVNCFVYSLCVLFVPQTLATDFDPITGNPNGPGADTIARSNFLRALSQSDLSKQAKSVQVSVDNGTAVIRGNVKDDRERQAVGAIAEESGFSGIKNEIKVESASKSTKASKPLIVNRRK